MLQKDQNIGTIPTPIQEPAVNLALDNASRHLAAVEATVGRLETVLERIAGHGILQDETMGREVGNGLVGTLDGQGYRILDVADRLGRVASGLEGLF